MMRIQSEFWRDAFTIRGSVTQLVLPDVLVFGLIALVAFGLSAASNAMFGFSLGLEVAPFEYAGAALGLLLILRTNAGYDRWWEARKLWGGMVNQSRNLAISSMSYGPNDESWRTTMMDCIVAFPAVSCASLRGEPPQADHMKLVGRAVAEPEMHAPSAISSRIAGLLRHACESKGMDRYAFLQIDRERALLIDHVGACERILKTPLPAVYAIKTRRLIMLFLCTIPFALLNRMQTDWLVPAITMLVAYPLLALDRIGAELQNPFSRSNLGHLPLDEINSTIERNVRAIGEQSVSPQ